MSANRDFVDLLQPQIDQGLQLWLEGDALRFKAPQDLMTADLMQVLKANKEHIREWLKAQANDHANNETDLTQSTLSQKKVVDEFPLASTQGAIWMLYRLAPNSPAYNTAFVATTRALDSQAVYQALQALFIRHPMLRSTFIDTDSGPRQRVWNYVDIPFAEVDASGLTELQLQAELKAEADGAFDLQMQSCLRVKIFKNSPIGHVLVATVHHIGADLWALLIIAQEIKHFYEQASLGEALEVKATEYNYQHHVDWQQHYLLSESGQRAKDYWQRQLQNAPTQITLPVDKTRPPMLAMETALYSESLAQDQYQTVKDFCKSQSITPFVFVQTAFQLLVHHLTDANDFLIGTPTMGRSQLGMDKVVGDFANPVVLRAQLTAKTQLQALYKHVQQTLLHAMEFQDYPFPAVVQDCNPARDTSRTPLFQMMFVWHQGNPDAVLKDGFIQDVLPLSGPRGAPYDVLLAISDLGNQFDFNWTYQHSLYETDTIKYYQGLLLEMIQHMLSAQANDAVSDIIQFLPSDKKRSIVPGVCEDTTARIMSAFPVFKGYDAVTVLQRAEVNSANTGAIEDHKVLKRFFIAANDQQVIEATPYLRQLCDDVVVLPRLPRNAAGHWDLLALAKVPCINQKALQKQWNDIDIVASDWQLIHRHCYLPSFSRFDYQGTGAASSATAGLSVVTQSNVRPDAWAKSQPLVLTGDEPKNLVDALRKTAERYPHKGIYFVAETSTSSQLPKPYSYLQLWQDAQRIAAGIKKLGFKRDTILLLQMSVSAQFFATWWAVLLNGLRPLNVAIPDHYNKKNGVAKKLYNVAHNFDGLVVIADTDKVKVTDNWLQTKPVIDIELLSNNNDEFLPRPAKSQDTAFLQLTSGSTGTPKAIQITHGGILHHVYASATYNDYHPDNLTLNWLPFDHVVPILTFHLKDVVLGINQIQVPTAAVLNEPLLWPELLSRYNVTHSWAPNFAYQRVLDALKSSQVEQRWNLSSLQFLMNAGEQVLPGSVKGFQGALSTYGLKASVVQPAFGMAEACTCMTYNNDSQQLLERHICYGSDETNTANLIDMVAEHRASHHFIDLGGVVPGVEVRITDENNIVVKEGVIGRMQIRGSVITPGYLNNEEANAEAFVGDGWFNSGDLGFLWDGRLTLTGREKEMIVV
ncbi:MAG: condensation domain-containing protein, partial [Pseudomonadales bacterium]|nr:condensation domain-containing protein [Pseudomonadales bacterium]